MKDDDEKQGFAAMPAEKRKKLASKGGKAAHAKGRAHEFTSAEARAAGWKGGMAVSKDRAYMAELGRKGGFARAQKRREQEQQQPEPAKDGGEEPEGAPG